MARPFTIIAEGEGARDSGFEAALAEATGGEVEAAGAMLSAGQSAADLFRFVIEHKEAILFGFTLAEAALKIVDKLIGIAAKWNTKLVLSTAGQNVPIDGEHRTQAAALVEQTLSNAG